MEPREDCFEGNQTARWEAVQLILVTDDNDFGMVAVGMERNNTFEGDLGRGTSKTS